MTIVLDTCAAVEVVLGRAQSTELSELLAQAEWVVAPDLYISEVSNVFWKYHRFENLPFQDAEEKLEQSINLVDDFVSTRDFYKEAFMFSCLVGRPVYDSMFLVLARRLSARLLTVDQKLRKIAQDHSITA